MKFTIERQKLYLFGQVLKKKYYPKPLPKDLNLQVSATNDGIRFWAISGPEAVSMTSNGTIEQQGSCLIPYSAVIELFAKKNNTVSFLAEGENIAVSWTESGIPRNKTFPVSKKEPLPIPERPKNMASAPESLLDHLATCSQFTDKESLRYPLSYMKIATDGTIGVTNGREALHVKTEGYHADQDIGIPKSGLLKMKELRTGQSIFLGESEEHAVLEIGAFHLYFEKMQGKFPNLERIFQSLESDGGRFSLDSEDAIFLAKSLMSLPGSNDPHSPVHLTFGNPVTVRGVDAKGEQAVTITLARSKYEGTEQFLSVDRNIFLHFLGLGLSQSIVPKDGGILSFDGTQKFAWMRLEPINDIVAQNEITLSTTDVVPVKSTEEKNLKPRVSPTTTNPEPIMEKPKENTDKNQSQVVQEKSTKQDNPSQEEDAIRQLEDMAIQLRESYEKTRRLIRTLKSKKSQDRDVRTLLNKLLLQNSV